MATLIELQQQLQTLQQQVEQYKQIAEQFTQAQQEFETIKQQFAQLSGKQAQQLVEELASNTAAVRILKELVQSAVSSDAGIVIYSPTKIQVMPGVINAAVDWEKIEGADKYYVYYNALGSNPIRIGPTPNTSLTIPRLTQNTEYEVFVRASRAGQLSQPGAKVTFKTKSLN